MSSMPKPDLAFLLLQADAAAIGISVITNHPALLRSQLYAERKKLGLMHISFLQPPIDPENRLWLIKKDANNGENED